MLNRLISVDHMHFFCIHSIIFKLKLPKFFLLDMSLLFLLMLFMVILPLWPLFCSHNWNQLILSHGCINCFPLNDQTIWSDFLSLIPQRWGSILSSSKFSLCQSLSIFIFPLIYFNTLITNHVNIFRNNKN